MRFSAILLLSLLVAGSASGVGGPDLEERAIEVRDFIDGVVGGIDTLQIPEDIHDLPQPALPNGDPDPVYEITEAKVELGKLLFHDPAFSAASAFAETRLTGSCASCHFAQAGFRAGQIQSLGVGGRRFVDETGASIRAPYASLAAMDIGPTPGEINDAVDNPAIVAPSINMVAYFDALLWSGGAFQFGPEELPPVERQVRMAFEPHRMSDEVIQQIDAYVPLFEEAYPELAGGPIEELIDLFPIFRAIGAYERTVVSNQSPWDAFLAGDNQVLSFEELNGAELFFGQANCVACHSGPALGSTTYHALGVAEHPGIAEGEHDSGRFAVTQNPDDMFKFRAMMVRSLQGSGPFFHGGSAATVEDVIRYKDAAVPDQNVTTLSPLFVPLNLTEQEILDLTAFVADALYDPNMDRFTPAEVPSGRCVPHDDLPGRFDAECAPYGDADGDADVDLLDFGGFQACFGSDAALVGQSCAPFDRQGDEDVDLLDFSAFRAGVTGPNP